MKAAELRIGNWVLKGFPVLEPERLNASGIAFICSCEMADQSHYIEPIPITQEWLTKFGFTAKGFKIIQPNYRLLEWSYGKEFYISDMDTNTLYEVENVQFVHQLQNLFYALTGRELTIEP